MAEAAAQTVEATAAYVREWRLRPADSGAATEVDEASDEEVEELVERAEWGALQAHARGVEREIMRARDPGASWA